MTFFGKLNTKDNGISQQGCIKQLDSLTDQEEPFYQAVKN